MWNSIVITGGAGFIGSNLVRKLQEDHPKAHIIVIDNLLSGTFANLVGADGDSFRFRGDLIVRPLGEVDWPQLIRRYQPEVIFHQASITDTTLADEAEMIGDNVEAFRDVLDATCQGGARLVWASSAGTYGLNANGAAAARRAFRLEDAGKPANAYGFSKWMMENLHRRVASEHPELSIVGLRYFNVFGPREQNKNHMASMLYQLTQQMLAGHRPRVFVGGEQARDQVPVADVVDANIAAASDNAEPGIYNVGSGVATTFNQIIVTLNEALGTSYDPEYFENPYAFTQSYTRADLTVTKSGLAWQPSYDVRQAIIDYARWLKQSMKDNS